MLKLFQAATWLFAMTLSVRPAYASVTPAPPCDVLYQVCIAPTARARIAPSSIRKVIGSVCPLTTGTNSAVLTLLRSRPVATTSTSACPSSVLPNSRSEEHTSELQSQSNLVCRLLLEKKKKYKQHQ